MGGGRLGCVLWFRTALGDTTIPHKCKFGERRGYSHPSLTVRGRQTEEMALALAYDQLPESIKGGAVASLTMIIPLLKIGIVKRFLKTLDKRRSKLGGAMT